MTVRQCLDYTWLLFYNCNKIHEMDFVLTYLWLGYGLLYVLDLVQFGVWIANGNLFMTTFDSRMSGQVPDLIDQGSNVLITDILCLVWYIWSSHIYNGFLSHLKCAIRTSIMCPAVPILCLSTIDMGFVMRLSSI